MKLTKDQIEIETKKFEQAYPNKSLTRINELHPMDKAINLEHRTRMLNVWLACRESNNEIELPPVQKIIGPSPDYWHGQNEMRALIKNDLAEQGFHVKSQGE